MSESIPNNFVRAVDSLVQHLSKDSNLTDDQINTLLVQEAERRGIEFEQLKYALSIEGDLNCYFKQTLTDHKLAPIAQEIVESEGARVPVNPPSDLEVYYQNGINYLVGGHDPKNAKQTMEKVLALSNERDPLHIGASYYIGLASEQCGNIDQALEYLIRARDLAISIDNENGAKAAAEAIARLHKRE